MGKKRCSRKKVVAFRFDSLGSSHTQLGRVPKSCEREREIKKGPTVTISDSRSKKQRKMLRKFKENAIYPKIEGNLSFYNLDKNFAKSELLRNLPLLGR